MHTRNTMCTHLRLLLLSGLYKEPHRETNVENQATSCVCMCVCVFTYVVWVDTLDLSSLS